MVHCRIDVVLRVHRVVGSPSQRLRSDLNERVSFCVHKCGPFALVLFILSACGSSKWLGTIGMSIVERYWSTTRGFFPLLVVP